MKYNLKWSLADIDDVQRRLARYEDARTIAHAYRTSEQEVIDLCRRNDFRVPKPTLTPQGA